MFMKILDLSLSIPLSIIFELLCLLCVNSCSNKTFKELVILVDINELFDLTQIHCQNSGRRRLEFGATYVVKPRGKHQATIVWLHGLGDNGSR